MRRLLLLAVTVAALVAASPALATSYDEGTILPGRGATVGPDAIPVLLGTTKTEIVASLGPPVEQNANGYLAYSKQNLFDIYLDTRTNRVDVISVSGPRFCLPFGICMLQRGGLKALRQKYGSALKRERAEDGEIFYVFRNTVGGKKRATSFSLSGEKPGSRIVQIFVST